MDIKELRIGNIIGAISENNPVVVTDLFTSFDDVPMVNCDKFSERPISDFEPITITEEWLTKFGFVKFGDLFWLKYFDKRCNLETSIYYNLSEYEIEIHDTWEYGERKYIHELQNLFYALTGVELTENNV